LEYPERDLAPLCPLAAVPPFPEACPLPKRFPAVLVDPGAGVKFS